MTTDQISDTHAQSAPEGIITVGSDTLLELAGPESLKFLQGQTTADFNRAEPLDAIPGCFCDLKGRVLADFLAVIVTSERVLLRISSDIAEQLQEHLKKYLMFSKAELTPSDLRVFGALGAGTLAALDADPPADTDANPSIGARKLYCVQRGGAFLVAKGSERAELFAAPDTVIPAPIDDDLGWQVAGIAAGEARIRAATWGKYLPQDLNYDLQGFINFKKGCYTGQEVIARLHWRGTPKRRLYVARLPSAANHGHTATSGTPLFCEGKESSVGSITNAAWKQETLYLLIEATTESLDRGLRLADYDSPLDIRGMAGNKDSSE